MSRHPRTQNRDDRGVALYRLFGCDTLLYVGISNAPFARFREHAADKAWWGDVTHQTISWCKDRKAALKAEAEAIFYEHPKHNKSRPYTADEGRWRTLAREYPRLRELEVKCRAAQVIVQNCLWSEILSELHVLLDRTVRAETTSSLMESIEGVLLNLETLWDQDDPPADNNDLAFAAERLNALLPAECYCDACWEEMVS